jgi:hypothetical protein
VSFKRITGAVAVAAALSLPSVVSAQGAQGFVQIGPSDYGYADDGIGIKLGLDFAPNLNGIKGLGLTAFYAHTESDENYFGRRWNHDAHSFALGPTYTYNFPGTKFSIQGRGFLELSHVRWDSPCCRHSDTDLDIGIGIGGQYALDGKYAIRFDYDMLGVGADLLSIGLGFKF